MAASAKVSPKPDGLLSMVAPVLRLVAASAAARAIKNAATEATTRVLLAVGGGLAAAVGLFCFSRAALTVMERSMDPAEAWTAMGAFYGLVGGALIFAASRKGR